MAHTVVITGSNLAGATSVSFGGLQATNLVHDAGTGALTVTLPRPTFEQVPVGGVNVIVSAGEGNVSNAATFTWTNPNFMLDNGALRFGGGGANSSSYVLENSLTTGGVPKQPFYKDGSRWLPLTFSTLPLNYAVGTKPDSVNATWSGAKHVADAALSNLRVRLKDDSGNLVGATTTAVQPGSGTLYVDGQLTVNSNQLKIEHEYFLGSGNDYVRVTTRVTNLTSTLAENVHFWIGTRDDWVGWDNSSVSGQPRSDAPYKTKGTVDLATGVFSQIASIRDPANALQIVSRDGSVLFFATPAAPVTTNMVITGRSVDTLATTDPATVQILTTGDEAYALVARMGNLLQNQASEIVWYYAAAEPSELARVVADVAAAAGGSASLSSPTTEGGVLAYSVDLVEADVTNVTHHVLVVDDGATAPTAAQITAGVNYGSVSVRYAGSGSTSKTTQSFTVAGLSEASAYTFYAVSKYDAADNSASNQYSSVTSGNFVTLPGTPTVSSVTAGNGQVSVTIAPSGSETNFKYSTDSWATSSTRSPASTAGLVSTRRLTCSRSSASTAFT
jgi:hypothetical protein